MTAHSVQDTTPQILTSEELLTAEGIPIANNKTVEHHKWAEYAATKKPTRIGLVCDRYNISPEFAERHYEKFSAMMLLAPVGFLMAVGTILEKLNLPSFSNGLIVTAAVAIVFTAWFFVCKTSGTCVYPAKWVTISWSSYNEPVPKVVERRVGKALNLGFKVEVEELQQGVVKLDPVAWLTDRSGNQFACAIWKHDQMIH